MIPHQAHLTSASALDSFRGQLIQYLERTTATLDELIGELRKTAFWLEEQRTFWERQIKRRARALEDAQHAVFAAKLSKWNRKDTTSAVLRARRALREAEEKLRCVRIWQARYQKEIEPLMREIEKLRTFLTQDLKKGVSRLTRIRRRLDAYVTTHENHENHENHEDSKSIQSSADTNSSKGSN